MRTKISLMKRISLENVDIVDIKKKTLTQLDFLQVSQLQIQWYRICNTKTISVLVNKNYKEAYLKDFFFPTSSIRTKIKFPLNKNPKYNVNEKDIFVYWWSFKNTKHKIITFHTCTDPLLNIIVYHFLSTHVTFVNYQYES